jgi:hypothetical protein
MPLRVPLGKWSPGNYDTTLSQDRPLALIQVKRHSCMSMMMRHRDGSGAFRPPAVHRVKPLFNAVQPLCNAAQHSVKQCLAPNVVDFRRFLPLCNQCNGISRCCSSVRQTCGDNGMRKHAGGCASDMGWTRPEILNLPMCKVYAALVNAPPGSSHRCPTAVLAPQRVSHRSAITFHAVATPLLKPKPFEMISLICPTEPSALAAKP